MPKESVKTEKSVVLNVDCPSESGRTAMLMTGVGIHDDDFLAVHHTEDVRSGQIVVAGLEHEVTVICHR